MLKKGFTLIELIVVITILAILGTIAFISFNGYSSQTRNAKVTSDLTTLHKSLSVLKIKNGVFPIPDSIKNVSAGVGNIVTYEGEIGNNVKNTVKADNNLVSPTGKNYEYAVNKDQKKLLLIGNLEEVSAYNTPANAESDLRIFKGDELLVLYDSNNTFVEDDILNPQNGGTTAYLGEKKLTKTTSGIHPKSCKEIKDIGYGNANGSYKINLNGTETDVYCDMAFKGGGWIRLENNLATVMGASGTSVTLTDGLYSANNNPNGNISANSPIPNINLKYGDVKVDYNEVMYDLERTTTIVQCAYLYGEANSGKRLGGTYSAYEENGKYVESPGLCTWDIKKWTNGATALDGSEAKKWRSIWKSFGNNIYFVSSAAHSSDTGIFKTTFWVR